MSKTIEIIKIILQLLTLLLPMIEKFAKDNDSKEKVKNAMSLLNDVKDVESNNC